MRRRKTADREGQGRLLAAWEPPPEAGEALGCLATTFTFQAGFFESECLGRMLQLESEPESGSVYLIEREEKLARLKSATVIVDATHARGKRSLRWDLIPFRASPGILHAKLAILLWQNVARVLVGSANLTEQGYRQNLEVFCYWDFCEGGATSPALFDSVTGFASELIAHCREKNPAGSPALERSREFLAEARRRVAAWMPPESAPRRLRTALVPVTPRSPSVLAQLGQLWPVASPPDTLFVLSPFFDQGPMNLPAQTAWEILRRRGRAEITFSVVAEPIRSGGKLMIHAPKSLVRSIPTDRDDHEVTFEQIKMSEQRALHAKSLWLRNERSVLHCIGSSNFTSAGLGLGPVRNWELNVAGWFRMEDREELRLRKAAWPDCEEELIDLSAVQWSPVAGLEDEANPALAQLPGWCGAAVLGVRADGRSVLELGLNNAPSEGWTILGEDGIAVLLTAESWHTAGSPVVMDLDWPAARPPSELMVRVNGQSGDVRWPVEIRAFSDLPPPQELRDLTLDELLEVLTSALPLHRCLAKLRRREGDEETPLKLEPTLDPLRRFSRAHHLLERTRRFSLAMSGVRQRLESPIPSEEYLQWRLYGPVGVAKVAESILKEAGSDGEKAFLLGELALEISQVRPNDQAGCLPRAAVRKAIRALVERFETQAAPLLVGTEGGLRKYVEEALRKANA